MKNSLVLENLVDHMVPLVDNRTFENIKSKLNTLLNGRYSLIMDKRNSILDCVSASDIFRNSGLIEFKNVESKINEFFEKERKSI